MGKKRQDEKGGLETAPAEPQGPRYQIRVPAPGFTRIAFGPFGLNYVDSVATTDDPRAATHAIECGYCVTDLHASTPARPAAAEKK